MNLRLTPVTVEQDWSPQSWRRFPALQQPKYQDNTKLARVSERLGQLPPLVTSGEILELKRALAEAQEGRRFLLHGGDCAESEQNEKASHVVLRLLPGGIEIRVTAVLH